MKETELKYPKDMNTDKMFEQYPDMLRSIVAIANRNNDAMDGTTGPVKEIIADGDIVFGVWQDTHNKCGIGVLILKGYKLLRECIASGKPITAKISAVKCESYEHAIAAYDVLGVHEELH